MGFQCDKEVYAKKLQWQGLARFQIVYIRKKFRLEKKNSLPSTANPAEPKTRNTKANRAVLWKLK